MCSFTRGTGVARAVFTPSDGSDERTGSDDLDHALQVVGQDVEADLGLHAPHSMVRLPHKNLNYLDKWWAWGLFPELPTDLF